MICWSQYDPRNGIGSKELIQLLYWHFWRTTWPRRYRDWRRIKSGHQYIASFLTYASLCCQEGLTRFNLQPKLHIWKASLAFAQPTCVGNSTKWWLCWKKMYIPQDRINSNHSLQDPRYHKALAAPLQVPHFRLAGSWTGSPCLSARSLEMETSGLKTECQS